MILVMLKRVWALGKVYHPPNLSFVDGLVLTLSVLHRLYKLELVTAKSLVTSRVDRPFTAFF